MEHYQYSRFDKHLVAVDCVIFGYEEGELKVLLFHRAIEPALGRWSLLGGFIRQDETLGDAARRVLKKTTGLENVFQEQVYAFSKPDRDPAGRVISVTYFALIRIDQQNHVLVEQYKAKWWPIGKLPRLIFDHREMLDIALTRLQKKAETEVIGPELLGEPFTLTSLKKLYEAIFQQNLDAGNFRKRINTLGVLRNTGEKDKSGSKKGAFLYVVKPKTGWTKEEGKRVTGDEH
jgi:ADP-ribose pyrophosphatase YjhB (NUDIX family)